MAKLYDERFVRMWEFYLSGGIVLFETGGGCNFQVQYIRDRTALPIARDYMLETERRYRSTAAETAAPKKPRSSRTALETSEA
jgi:cyclopropane-fatty-acyl-phospholipid synthase